MRMNLSLGTTMLIATGAVATWALLRRQSRAGHGLPKPQVRNAGPEEMALPPRRWDMVDQQLDETFPASDPPGNY